MAFCTVCGKEINDDAVVCIHCGCATAKVLEDKTQQANTSTVTDSSSVCL